MSLREQLEAKARRRVLVPVVVSDPGEDQARAGAAHAEAMAAAVRGGDQAEAQRHLEDATAALRSHYVDIEFVALPADQFEAVIAAFPAADDADGDDGSMDWERALPVLAASCAVDASLQDADWWRTQLVRDEWTYGEKLTLWHALLHINYRTPDPLVPKG